MKQTKQGIIIRTPNTHTVLSANAKLFVRQVGDEIEVWELKFKMPIIEVIKDAQKEVERREANDETL